MVVAKRGARPVDDETGTPRDSASMAEMPWVLLSNQIQQLNLNMNERFNDQRVRLDDLSQRFDRHVEQVDRRFEQVDRRFEQVDRRFEQVDHRFEQVDRRFEQVDHKLEAMDGRLAFRMNTWVGVVIAMLTAILGFFTGQVHF